MEGGRLAPILLKGVASVSKIIFRYDCAVPHRPINIELEITPQIEF